jgi:hypothetical protein
MTGTATKEHIQDVLLVRGTEIPTQRRMLEQAVLKFYPDNPRVYSVLRGNGNIPSQQEIQERLLEMEHVKALVQSIKANGGLIEPLVVRDGTFEVLEGNSRLAAYRHLAKIDPIKWGRVKCTVLPADVEEALVFALLGEYHIKGKKDWAPYEQAGFLYRRLKQHNDDVKTLALEIGLSSKKVKHLVDTYSFMLAHNEVDVNRWSYYDEYLKSNKIKHARTRFAQLDELVVKKINSDEIERAVDVRDKLQVICGAPGAALEKFVDGEWTFNKAYRHACRCGGDSVPLKKLIAFRKWITLKDTRDELTAADGQMRSKLRFEMRKISSRSSALLRKLK